MGEDAKVLLDEIDEFLSPNNNYTAYRLALGKPDILNFTFFLFTFSILSPSNNYLHIAFR